MFGSLRKKLEEVVAQVSPFDNGKTAATVRAARQPSQPAQTINRPNQSFFNKVVDQVSSNTQADQYRRQQIQDSTRGTDEAMRNLQKQALTGQVDKNVAAAKIRALGTSDVQPNTAENVLKPTTPAQIAGQKVIDTAMNRKVAPVALGVGRSAAGTVEGVSGLYDLATPGTGTNRLSKVAQKAGQTTDQAVKDNNYNQLAYKASQAATDVAQYAIGAGGVKAVGKATTTLPYVPKVVSFADRVAQPLTKPISGAVENGVTNLASKGFAGRVAGRTLQNATKPGYQAVNAGFTALQAGKEASHGTEVSPIGVTTNLVAGGVGFPLAGAVGGEVTRPIVNKAVSGLRKTNLVRPSNLNPGEVADLARMNEIAKTGAILDDNIYQRGVYAAQKAGIDHRDANQVDTLLGAHRNHDTLVQQRKQAIQDAKARVTRNPQTLLEPEGGYARIPVGKNDPAPDLSIEQKTLINDYAEMLQGMDDGNGVTILPDGSRASSNSQFYRKVFAEKGRAPSKADWFDEARRQIESGKAGFGASDDYKLLPKKKVEQPKNVDPLESLKQEAKEIKTRTIKTADGKNEYVAQLGNSTKDRVGRQTGFKATETSPNFKTEGEMNAWIKKNIDAQPQPPKSTPTTNKGLKELSDIREQYSSDKEFFDKVILENQEAPGKIGEFARHIAYRDAKEGSIYNKNYLTEILDDELAPINTKLDNAVYKSAQREDLARSIRELEKSTGQKGLYSKVAKEMQGMTEQEQIDYMGKAMLTMRENGVLAMDHVNKQSAKSETPFQKDLQTAGLAPKSDEAKWLKATKEQGTMRPNMNESPVEQASREVRAKNGGGLVANQKEIQARTQQIVEEREPPDFLKPTNAKGVIIKESKPQPDGSKIVVRAKKNPETGRLQQFEERVDKNTDLPKAYEEPKVTEELSGYGKNQKPVTNESVKSIDKTNSEDFMKITNEYLGGQKSGSVNAVAVGREFNKRFGNLSKEEKIQVILSKDNPENYPPPNKKIQEAVDYLKNEFDTSYNYFTQDKGIKMGYQHEYFPRIYKNPKTGELIDANEYKLLQTGSARQKSRTASNINLEHLDSKDPAEILQKYHTSLESAAAGKRYLNQLERSGLVIKGDGAPVRGLRPIVAEGMQTDGAIYYAKPDVAKKLDRIFGSQEASGAFEKVLAGGKGLNSFWQSVVLSGGVPNTPINAFGIMQLMKHSMALHPIQAGRAFMTGLSKNDASKFFDANVDIVKQMNKNGLDVRYDYSLGSNKGIHRVAKAGEEDGLTGYVREGWNEITNNATFNRFMPALEVLHYKNVYQGLLKKGKSPEEAGKLAADTTANFFGKNTMAKEAVRNKAGQDFIGATMFAPRFRESMLNFWGRNAQALKPGNLGKAEYRDNQKFLVGAAITYLAMDSANYAINGTHMYQNPEGKKDKLLLPGGDVAGGKYIGIPFLPSIATVPRNAVGLAGNLATGNFKEAGKNAGSFASMPLKTASELLLNENYFGQRIVDEEASSPEKLLQGGAYIAKSTMQPWIREGLNVAGQGLPENVKKPLGIKEKGAFETASNALEAPLRFYDPAYFKGGSEKFAGGANYTPSEKPKLGSAKARESFNTPEARKFFALPEDQQKEQAKNDPELYKLYKQKEAVSKALSTPMYDPSLSDEDKKVLTRNDRLTNKGRDVVIAREKDFEYKKELAFYNKAKAEGSLTADEDAKRQKSLKKYEAGSTYDMKVRDLHNKSKTELATYFDTKEEGVDKAELMKKLLEYDDKITELGGQAKNKFRDKYGNVAIYPKASGSGRGGRKGRGKSKSNFDYSKNLFADNGTSSTSVSSNLRKILAKATKS